MPPFHVYHFRFFLPVFLQTLSIPPILLFTYLLGGQQASHEITLWRCAGVNRYGICKSKSLCPVKVIDHKDKDSLYSGVDASQANVKETGQHNILCKSSVFRCRNPCFYLMLSEISLFFLITLQAISTNKNSKLGYRKLIQRYSEEWQFQKRKFLSCLEFLEYHKKQDGYKEDKIESLVKVIEKFTFRLTFLLHSINFSFFFYPQESLEGWFSCVVVLVLERKAHVLTFIYVDFPIFKVEMKWILICKINKNQTQTLVTSQELKLLICSQGSCVDLILSNELSPHRIISGEENGNIGFLILFLVSDELYFCMSLLLLLYLHLFRK
ncbi:putative signal peptide protein [Puccinia sorghi]|uniref:Putative signal peptide protein n=1 Tax=Puccinia sorghi TaxID=27349 RepID=A0A0L6VAL9_9BASI|nr:putative signal peptide protein [Puccinia sorghi]